MGMIGPRKAHLCADPIVGAFHDFYQAKMLECGSPTSRRTAGGIWVPFTEQIDPSELRRSRARKTKQVQHPSFDVRAALFGVLGVDLTQIHGMGTVLGRQASRRMRH